MTEQKQITDREWVEKNTPRLPEGGLDPSSFRKSGKKRTIVVPVVDKSGSMRKVREATVTGLNEQIQQMVLNAKDDPDNEYLFCSVSFNADVFEHSWLAPISELKEAALEDYVPEGGTALLDAHGYVVDKLLRTIGPDDAVLVVLFTDGEERDSKEYVSKGKSNLYEKATPVRELTKKLGIGQPGCRWTITIMGQGERYIRQYAQATGLEEANCAIWDASDAESTSFAFANARSSLKRYGEVRAAGATCSTNYHNAAGGALANFVPKDNDLASIIGKSAPVKSATSVKSGSWLTNAKIVSNKTEKPVKDGFLANSNRVNLKNRNV